MSDEMTSYIVLGRVLNKHGHVWFELTKVFGIGKSRSLKICKQSKIDPHAKLSNYKSADLDRIRDTISKLGFVIEGDLRKQIKQAKQRLVSIACYRGLRHRTGGRPVRGQKTGNGNARTAKKLNVKIAG